MKSLAAFRFSAAFLCGVGILSAATIEIALESQVVVTGAPAFVAVRISDVLDLYAFQFDIAFDPTILSAISVTEGGFLSSGGGTVFIPGAIDNLFGTIMFTASSLLGPDPGANGTGTLATLQFTSIGQGISPLTLSSVVLLDSVAADIAANVQNGSVTVVPEPGSGVLLLSGCVFMFSAVARRVKRYRGGPPNARR